MLKKPKKKISLKSVAILALFVLAAAIVYLFYRTMMNYESYFRIVMIAYVVVLVALVLVYVIYNRGFTRRGVTKEMLPADWSEEKKTEFVEDGERRFRTSRWLLIPIFAFLFTFCMDAIELFVLPFLREMFHQ